MSSFKCEKCKREFATQADLDEHHRIYFYSDGMDLMAPHDLAHLEQVVSFLLYSKKILKKDMSEIYKEYSILERKYHDLLDVKNKPLSVAPTEQKQLLECAIA